MENKELTLEEIQAKLDEARNVYTALQKTFMEKEKEIESKRKTELASKQAERKKEIETKENELNELICAYVKDYGSYNMKSEFHNNSAPLFWKTFGWL